MQIRQGLLVLLAGWTLSACGSSDSDLTEPDPDAQQAPCGPLTSGSAGADASALFETGAVPVFDFHLPSASWEHLKAHALDEEYVQALACVDGKAIGQVGLRFKGAYGSLANCFDGSGKNLCRKLGMKVKFDEYEPELRFHRLKRLNFHGYRYDDSYLRERLSYDLYREMNIAAPRASWARLRVNGEDQGLFGMVEQIDGRFTASRWPEDGDGNLYKEVWPGVTDEQEIVAHLETNEASADVSGFLAMSNALRAAAPAERRGVLARYVDLDELARYMAVDDAIANFDGVITYYTSSTPERARNHNFFLYERSSQRFALIPWDLESTFSLGSYYGSVPTWQEVPEDCSRTYPVWNGVSRVIAPGCDAVFQALAADLSGYHSAGRALLEGPFALDRMLERVDRHASFIRSDAESDPHGPGAQAFERAIAGVKQQIPALQRRLEQLLSGERSTPLLLDVRSVTDFESADGSGLYSGTSLLSNPATTASVELSSSEPLEGARSLRLLFSFANEVEPYQQWMFYTVPVADAPVDLSSFTGIRFKARASNARTLRIDLDSPNNSAASQGIRMGWNVSVSPEPASFSMAFAEARLPDWASDTGDSLARIVQTVTALSFLPQCNDRDVFGQLPEGTRDEGFVELDAIEFY